MTQAGSAPIGTSFAIFSCARRRRGPTCRPGPTSMKSTSQLEGRSFSPGRSVMNTSKMLILAALASLATAGAHAADAPKGACTLLTQPEIDSITGGKSGAGSAMDQEVPAKSGQPVTVYICMWPVPGIGGQVVISMAPMPPGQTAKSLSQDNAGMKALRDQHYTEEAKDFGQSSCSGMAPPASAKDGLS